MEKANDHDDEDGGKISSLTDKAHVNIPNSNVYLLNGSNGLLLMKQDTRTITERVLDQEEDKSNNEA